MVLKMTRSLICAIMAVLILLSAVSCDYLRDFYGEETTTPSETTGKPEVTTKPSETTKPEEDSQPIVTLPPADIVYKYKNPYTGLPCENDLTLARTIAFIVDNDYLSTPQDGVGSADILCEFINSEGQTSLMALYKDSSKASRVGPLGMANKVMLDVADLFDAITYARCATQNVTLGIAEYPLYIYEGGPLSFGFFEASDRKNEMGYNYSVIGEGMRLLFASKELGTPIESMSTYANIFTFYDGEMDFSIAGGKNCPAVYIPVSSKQHIQFVYSESEQRYYRFQFGDKAHIDSKNDSPISFKNMFFLMCEDDKTLADDEIKLKLPTRGTGYYACNGRYAAISWVRDSSGTLRFYKADGTELEVAPGQSYMGFFTRSQLTSISFTGK